MDEVELLVALGALRRVTCGLSLGFGGSSLELRSV